MLKSLHWIHEHDKVMVQWLDFRIFSDFIPAEHPDINTSVAALKL